MPYNMLIGCAALVLAAASAEAPRDASAFEGSADVGSPRRAGTALYDAAQKKHSVTGGGQNMWFARDSFHFVWKKMSGDLTLAADITFPEKGVEPHRKACLMVRQDLDAGSAYADAALHGDGLTSLQYREEHGGLTREIQSNVKAPRRLRLEKRGKYVSMSVAREGEDLRPAGGSFRLELSDPFYVGLAVCAHNDDLLETAQFTNVEIAELSPRSSGTTIHSTLETVDIASRDRRVVWHAIGRFEAPNWSRDGAQLYFNQDGRIRRLPLAGGDSVELATGFAVRCNNDHGISPDGKLLAVSDQSLGDRRSRIYVGPIEGGALRQVTELGPSYWHGWSPDGKTLAYCAERGGEFDVYTVSVDGGPERRLTTARGLDDGPDYSPDGGTIYFNSDRSGRMKIWRMKADGADPAQVTTDDWNDWFPHPSPDGKWIVFLSYSPDVAGHPEDKDVVLRLLPAAGGPISILAKVFGGQGTINVPSWSPDGKKLAFVSYQLLP